MVVLSGAMGGNQSDGSLSHTKFSITAGGDVTTVTIFFHDFIYLQAVGKESIRIKLCLVTLVTDNSTQALSLLRMFVTICLLG